MFQAEVLRLELEEADSYKSTTAMPQVDSASVTPPPGHSEDSGTKCIHRHHHHHASGPSSASPVGHSEVLPSVDSQTINQHAATSSDGPMLSLETSLPLLSDPAADAVAISAISAWIAENDRAAGIWTNSAASVYTHAMGKCDVAHSSSINVRSPSREDGSPTPIAGLSYGYSSTIMPASSLDPTVDDEHPLHVDGGTCFQWGFLSF
jgi:hypothetical protein